MPSNSNEGPEVLVEKKGRVGYLTLNRPDRLNAFTVEMLHQIELGLTEFDEDDNIAVVVLKGKGRAFCSGKEIGEASAEYFNVTGHRDRKEVNHLGLWFHHTFWEYRKPVILQLQGYCYGGATFFLGVTDLVVAASDTLIGFAESKAFAVEGTLGGLPLSIGPRWTKALLLTGDAIDAVTAERIGMINKAVPPEELDEYTDWLAARIARSDTSLLALHKQMVNSVYDALGLYAALKAGLAHGHMEHREDTFQEFMRRVQDDGVKSALDWAYAPVGGKQTRGMPTFLDGPRAEREWVAKKNKATVR